ncbi:MAG: hypothetical protein EHM93_07800 [Bacteroidales bacterium]|nr:MAG: hypothetical protein EHM93_07800 [Bacteroidales bacterium]
MKQLALSILVIFIIVLEVNAQKGKLSVTNKKAIELYGRAVESYERYDFETAAKWLIESVDKEPKFIEAYLLLSQVFQEMRLADNAIDAANKAIAINPDFFPNVYFNLGNLYLYKGDYQNSINSYDRFLNIKSARVQTKKLAEKRKASCEFAIEAIQHPVPFKPVNLGDGVNTYFDEYWPSLSADENTLVITANVPKDSASEQVRYNRQEDFFISHRNSDGVWERKQSLGKPINTSFNEGAQSITADGKKMYYTVCRGVCNIFTSKRASDGTWSSPIRVPNINSNKFSNKQPSISPDGRTLYYVSNCLGGHGGYDIWKSNLREDGTWFAPENLGDTINTEGNEQSPFIHFDNQTLYFASDGHIGMGGFDLFTSKHDAKGNWTIPKNLGYPINTFRDEDGLVINARGTTAYYSSDRNSENGRDIYTFNLYPEIRPIPASYLTGTIKDAVTGLPVKANFNLIDLADEHEIMKATSSDDGAYLVCIPSERSYAFYASAIGYLFYSDHFDMKGEHSIDKPFKKDILLDPIKVNQTMVMRNIFFDTDSTVLKPESIVELNRLVDFLTVNKALRIEIGGHTDNQGIDIYNQSLSEKRAKAVVDYLTSHRIPTERLKWFGYGRLKPIADNMTEEGRALNRRTEVKITGM